MARESLQSGPQSPNLRIFGLIFNVNTIKIRKNLTNLAREYFSNIFLARHEIWVVHPWLKVIMLIKDAKKNLNFFNTRFAYRWIRRLTLTMHQGEFHFATILPNCPDFWRAGIILGNSLNKIHKTRLRVIVLIREVFPTIMNINNKVKK